VPASATPPAIGDGAGAPGPEGTAGQGALTSVGQKSRSDYDAIGVHVGSFILNPDVEIKETYNSNIYVTTTHAQEDYFTTISPFVSLNSGWNTHSLGLSVGGDINRYANHPTEDNDNYSVSANGRLDILEGMYAKASGGYQLLHEPRSSPNAANGLTPTEYSNTGGSIGFSKENSIIGIQLDASLNDYAYRNVATSRGVPVIQTNRDRTEYQASAKVSYEIVQGYHAVVKAIGSERDYRQKIDAGGLQRTSTGYEFDAGAAVKLASKVDGEVFVGYLSRSFDDPRLRDADGIGFGLSLLWNVNDLTSIKGSVIRSIEESILANASSILQTNVSVGVEHELLRNVILAGNFNYSNQEYQGFGRVDDVYGFDVSAKYLLNRYMSASIGAAYNNKASNSFGVAVGANYDQTMFTAKLRLQL